MIDSHFGVLQYEEVGVELRVNCIYYSTSEAGRVGSFSLFSTSIVGKWA